MPSERSSSASRGELVEREVELAGHRGDLLAHVLAVGDEQRVDEVLRREPRLAHEVSQGLGAAQAAEAGEGLGESSGCGCHGVLRSAPWCCLARGRAASRRCRGAARRVQPDALPQAQRCPVGAMPATCRCAAPLRSGCCRRRGRGFRTIARTPQIRIAYRRRVRAGNPKARSLLEGDGGDAAGVGGHDLGPGVCGGAGVGEEERRRSRRRGRA